MISMIIFSISFCGSTNSVASTPFPCRRAKPSRHQPPSPHLLTNFHDTTSRLIRTTTRTRPPPQSPPQPATNHESRRQTRTRSPARALCQEPLVSRRREMRNCGAEANEGCNSYNVSSEELFDLFGKFGPIRYVDTLLHPWPTPTPTPTPMGVDVEGLRASSPSLVLEDCLLRSDGRFEKRR